MLRTSMFSASFAFVAFLSTCVAGCGEDQAGSVQLPYTEGETVVVTSTGRTTVATPSAEGCLDVTATECIKPQEICGEGAASEVILDNAGALVTVVCYPSSGSNPPVDFVDGSVKPDADGTVIVLDEENDGEDITNNVELGGAETVMYGHGPDVSVIGGNLKVVGDDVVVRGVTVLGEVDLEGVNGVLTDCVIHGNLHVQGAGVIVSDCTVFGDVSYDGEGGAMVRNLVQANWRVRSEVTECSGNQAFEDDDENFAVANDELGDALACPAF